MPKEVPTLRRYLSRWKNETSVPDYFFEAWKILFHQKSYPDRDRILSLAQKDMVEELHLRPWIPDEEEDKSGYLPWNWGSVTQYSERRD